VPDTPNIVPNWAWTNVPTTTEPATTYVNAAQIVFSPWDFGLQFSHIVASISSKPPKAEEAADEAPEESETEISVEQRSVSHIVMSPQHTKAFLNALQDNVRKYEAQFGEIPSLRGDDTRTTGGG
jgi:Protein of unknown function (DUF3467)